MFEDPSSCEQAICKCRGSKVNDGRDQALPFPFRQLCCLRLRRSASIIFSRATSFPIAIAVVSCGSITIRTLPLPTSMSQEDAPSCPVACELADNGLFRVTRNRHGKISTFGVLDFLYLEEVLFLQERGLLEAWREDQRLSTRDLMELLPNLPVYLVYAHLRAQSYVLFRHTPTRHELLDQKLLLRQDALQAPFPTLHTLAWHVHEPNGKLARTRPGPPDFVVAVTLLDQSDCSLSQLQAWMDDSPVRKVKVAVVSDSGTVLMYGISGEAVPVLSTKVIEQGVDDD